MYKEHFHGSTGWIAATIASVCLALFVFAPTIEVENEQYRTIAICLILFSLPLALITCLQIKEIKDKCDASEYLDRTLGIFFIPALLFSGAGFIVLCFSIKTIYGLTIVFSMATVAFLWKWAVKRSS